MHLQWHHPLVADECVFCGQQVAQGGGVEARARLFHEHSGVAIFNGSVVVCAGLVLFFDHALKRLAIERERDTGEHGLCRHGEGIGDLKLTLAGIAVAVLNGHKSHQALDAALQVSTLQDGGNGSASLH